MSDASPLNIAVYLGPVLFRAFAPIFGFKGGTEAMDAFRRKRMNAGGADHAPDSGGIHANDSMVIDGLDGPARQGQERLDPHRLTGIRQKPIRQPRGMQNGIRDGPRIGRLIGDQFIAHDTDPSIMRRGRAKKTGWDTGL
jgi:hypothetical protein